MTTLPSLAAAARVHLQSLAKSLREPPRWLRVGGTVVALLLVGNVLYLGAQPFAAGLVGDGWDKLAHIALHFVLCTTLLFALGIRRGLWAVALCALFAAVDEFAQSFSPGRSSSFADWVASVAGAVLGLAAAHAVAWHAEINRLQRARHRRALLTRWLR